MLIYILYFIFIAILAIQYEFTPFENNYLLSAVAILLALLAGFRGIDVARDYRNYLYLFDTIYIFTNDKNLSYLATLEPGTVAIVLFFRSIFEINYGLAIMIFYAVTSLFLKVYSIKRLSINPYLTLLFYFSYFFLLYEMTQIRIGLASAIFLISLFYFFKGKRLAFAGLIILAGCFHYSAIFYLILLFFDTKTFNRNLYIVLMALSIILAFAKLPLFSVLGNFDPSNISDKLGTYIEISENGSMFINVFNSLNILNILCCIYLMFFVNKQTLLKDEKLIFFIKSNILSIFLLSFLAGVPAFSLRFSQLFSIAQIFLFTYLVRFLPFKKLNIFILVLLAGFFLYITGFYGNLLQPYKIINIK